MSAPRGRADDVWEFLVERFRLTTRRRRAARRRHDDRNLTPATRARRVGLNMTTKCTWQRDNQWTGAKWRPARAHALVCVITPPVLAPGAGKR